MPQSIEQPELSIQVNDIGALNVFKAAAESGVKRIIFSSSSAIYGDNSIPNLETQTPAPASPYAAHKILGEYYGRIYRQLHGLETVSLRYFNVFGPRQRFDSPYSGVISIFIDRIQHGLSPVVYGNGEQSRDFVYVSDVARANYLAAFQRLMEIWWPISARAGK